VNPVSQKESSGLRVNYYLVQVDYPQREEQPPYQAECEDIIDALGLTPDEANIFKEIWRTANERTHGKGKEGNTPLRATQKLVHYSGRLLKKAQRASGSDAKAASARAAVDTLAGHEPRKPQNTWWAWDGNAPDSGPALPDVRVEIKRRDGNTAKGRVRSFMWKHLQSADPAGSDIIAWRCTDQ
jgi:hypothetical protein